MNNETKKEIRQYAEKLHKELSFWEKVLNTWQFIYYVSPIGYFFHHDMYLLYVEALTILADAANEETQGNPGNWKEIQKNFLPQ